CSRWIESKRAWYCHRRREFRVHPGTLPKRGDRRTNYSLRKSLLIDVGYIEDLEAPRTIGGVEVFAAQNDVLDIAAAMLVCLSQARSVGEVTGIVRRISNRLKVTSDDRLRLVCFSPYHGLETALPTP